MFNRPLKNRADEHLAKIVDVACADQRWSAIIIENLPYMEKQCRKAVTRYGHGLHGSASSSFSGNDVTVDNDAVNRLRR